MSDGSKIILSYTLNSLKIERIGYHRMGCFFYVVIWTNLHYPEIMDVFESMKTLEGVMFAWDAFKLIFQQDSDLKHGNKQTAI